MTYVATMWRKSAVDRKNFFESETKKFHDDVNESQCCSSAGSLRFKTQRKSLAAMTLSDSIKPRFSSGSVQLCG